MAGFFKMDADVLARKDLSAAEKLVHCVFMDLQTRGLYHGVRTIAMKTAMSTSTVRIAKHKLARLGLIGVAKTATAAIATCSEICAPSVAKIATPNVAENTTPSERQTRQTENAAHSLPPDGGDAKNPDLFGDVSDSGKRRKPRESDPVWDAVVAYWFPAGVPPSGAKEIGVLVRDLKAQIGDGNGHPWTQDTLTQEIKTREQRYREWLPDAACTPRAVVKHWQRLASPDCGKRADENPSRFRSGRVLNLDHKTIVGRDADGRPITKADVARQRAESASAAANPAQRASGA